MKECLTLARARPWLTALGLLGAVFVGTLTSAAIWSYRIANAPAPAHLISLKLMPRSGTSAYWFIAHFITPIAVPCLRQSVHLLYRDNPDANIEPRTYYTLSASMNGAGLRGTVSEYELLFFLPIGFPQGDWYYIIRTHYSCPPFQLVHRDFTTDPVLVPIPHELGNETFRAIRNLEPINVANGQQER